MEKFEIKPIAVLISFIIWLDIDITIARNFVKKKYKRKSERFIEKAHANNNYVLAKSIDYKCYEVYHGKDYSFSETRYKVTYEYIVNGKRYTKKLVYSSSDYPIKLFIYYNESNPRKSMAENEVKDGVIFRALMYTPSLSILFGIPIFSVLISKIISLF